MLQASVESFISPHGGRIFVEVADGKSELWACLGSPFLDEAVPVPYTEALKPVCTEEQFKSLVDGAIQIVNETSTHSPKVRCCASCRDKCCLYTSSFCAPCICAAMCMTCGCMCCPCVLMCAGNKVADTTEALSQVSEIKTKVEGLLGRTATAWGGKPKLRVEIYPTSMTNARSVPALDTNGQQLTFDFQKIGTRGCWPPVGLCIVFSLDKPVTIGKPQTNVM